MYSTDKLGRTVKLDTPWARYGLGVATEEDYEYMDRVVERMQRIRSYRRGRCVVQTLYIVNWVVLGAAFLFAVIGNVLGGVPSGWFAIVLLALVLLLTVYSITSFARLLHLLNHPEKYNLSPEKKERLKIDKIIQFTLNFALVLVIFFTLMC